MNAIDFPHRRHVQCHVLSFPNAERLGRLDHMTVGASDLAFRDLREDRFPDESGTRHSGDVTPFVPEVIELKNDRIALAAINARMAG